VQLGEMVRITETGFERMHCRTLGFSEDQLTQFHPRGRTPRSSRWAGGVTNGLACNGLLSPAVHLFDTRLVEAIHFLIAGACPDAPLACSARSRTTSSASRSAFTSGVASAIVPTSPSPAANVLDLQWSAVDLRRRTAWVHGDEAKGGEAIGVPLNDDATPVLNEEKGKHTDRVFTYQRQTPRSGERAGIKNFRWHDLRHVWATWQSWPVRTMAELQELGAWKSELMVKPYAHFAPEQLHKAVHRLATFSLRRQKQHRRNQRKFLNNWVPDQGSNPETCGINSPSILYVISLHH